MNRRSIGVHASDTVRLMSQGPGDSRLVTTTYRVTVAQWKRIREIHVFTTEAEATAFFQKAEAARIDVEYVYDPAPVTP